MSRRVLLAWFWTLVILMLCWIPRAHLPAHERVPGLFFIPNADKLVHAGIFAVWGFLWMRVSQPPHEGRRVLVAGLALAIISELGQLMPFVHRDAGLADGLADVVGVAMGMVASRLLRKFVASRSASSDVL